MNNLPLVSIIIPTYNRAHLIAKTLESVISQTYKNWECIIVDDGSTDNTEDIVKSYVKTDDRISFHTRPDTYKRYGNGARNYGFDISKGEYINWFDSDDIMLENFIESRIEFSNYNIVLCSYIITDENLNVTGETLIDFEFENLLIEYSQWKENVRLTTNGALFSKKFLTEGNYRFDEQMLRSQERELFFRIFSTCKASDIKIVKKQLYLYRQHDQTITAKKNTYNADYIKNFCFIFIQSLEYSLKSNNKKLYKISYDILCENITDTILKSDEVYNYINSELNKRNIKIFNKYTLLIKIYKKINIHSRLTTGPFRKLIKLG